MMTLLTHRVLTGLIAASMPIGMQTSVQLPSAHQLMLSQERQSVRNVIELAEAQAIKLFGQTPNGGNNAMGWDVSHERKAGGEQQGIIIEGHQTPNLTGTPGGQGESSLNPQPLPPGKTGLTSPVGDPGSESSLNPQPLPPGKTGLTGPVGDPGLTSDALTGGGPDGGQRGPGEGDPPGGGTHGPGEILGNTNAFQAVGQPGAGEGGGGGAGGGQAGPGGKGIISPRDGMGSAFTNPGETHGFNPQPEPPGDKNPMNTFVNPGTAQGFNPQPEPPGDKNPMNTFVNPGTAQGFNPQPEPPGDKRPTVPNVAGYGLMPSLTGGALGGGAGGGPVGPGPGGIPAVQNNPGLSKLGNMQLHPNANLAGNAGNAGNAFTGGIKPGGAQGMLLPAVHPPANTGNIGGIILQNKQTPAGAGVGAPAGAKGILIGL